MSGAADRKPGSSTQHGNMRILAVRLDFCHSFEIHDVRSVNPHKPRRVERAFQARYRLLLQVFLAFRHQSHIVVLGLCVVEPAYWNDEDAGSVAHRYSVETLRGWPCGCGKVVRV